MAAITVRRFVFGKTAPFAGFFTLMLVEVRRGFTPLVFVETAGAFEFLGLSVLVFFVTTQFFQS